jgi:hypothetical protein
VGGAGPRTVTHTFYRSPMAVIDVQRSRAAVVCRQTTGNNEHTSREREQEGGRRGYQAAHSDRRARELLHWRREGRQQGR